jgi:iron complex outermembrane receptor protein
MKVALPGRMLASKMLAGKISADGISDRRYRRRRHLLATTGGLLSMLSIAPALGQESADAPAPSQIIVTGSRIVRDGYSAPTPVTVMSQADITAQAPANISDFVNQLPSIAGSGTSGTQSGGLSNAVAGINTIGLRGLGTGRTLVLLDSQRSVASTVGGVVDINTIPQDLVERVEVVTGGASAAYGSDAVGGVVNFVLKKDYKGFRVGLDQGISTHGDGRNYKIVASAGLSLLDDRLHMLFNGEFFHQNGVDTIDREWNDSGYFMINNPTYNGTNGQPLRLVGSGVGPSGYTAGGLIGAGPLRGTYFLGAGQTGQLTYGTVLSPWMVGGDTDVTLAGHIGTNSLIPHDERLSFFNRTAILLQPLDQPQLLSTDAQHRRHDPGGQRLSADLLSGDRGADGGGFLLHHGDQQCRFSGAGQRHQARGLSLRRRGGGQIRAARPELGMEHLLSAWRDQGA